MKEVSFDLTVAQLASLPEPRLPLTFLWEFLMDGRTPARAMTDEAMKNVLSGVSGKVSIIELGASGDYYRNFVSPSQAYRTSNIVDIDGCDMVIDMTQMDLRDQSVDALVSVFALEHLYDFHSVFSEQYRVLKPGGRLVLVVPFLYYYHAAPDDYFRFTSSALDNLLQPLRILVRQPLGNRWLLLSELLHEKKIMGSKFPWFLRLVLRLVALPLLFFGLKGHDPRYAFGYTYVCEKEL